MIKIGNLKLKSNLILAPMAGVSDLPFRMLNRKFGCELAFIEMLNCRSLSYRCRRTREMLTSDPKDRPLGLQLLGCEPKFILKAMDVLKKQEFDLLDFNAACPAKKVVRRGEGASLLKEPKKLESILKLLVAHSSVPVTLKIRIGWDKDSINAADIALRAQDAGISALFVHGRTKQQGYSGGVDYQAIRKVKEACGIPVIASGDIFSAELIKKMFKETSCDGVAVARGALGNPWIFNGSLRPEVSELVDVMAVHLDACVDFYGERIGVVAFRKFFSWYTKGLRKVHPLREQCCRARTRLEMMDVVNICRTLVKQKSADMN